MRIRPYQPENCAAVIRLFYQTVHIINARDYTPSQLDAWAPAHADVHRWQSSLIGQTTYIAEDVSGHIVGFGNIDTQGLLDCLYVHHAYQRQGIATALLAKLELQARAQGCTRIMTHASLTAQPFFAHHGFRVEKQQIVERKGIRMPNFIMIKPL